jgi:hypothetical protein
MSSPRVLGGIGYRVTAAAVCAASVFLAGCPSKSSDNADTTPAPTVTIGANPTTVANGASSALSWSSTDATSCTASGAWSGAMATSGAQSTGALTTAGSSTFTLTCTGAGGSGTKSVTVTVLPPPPTVTFSASPIAIASGASSTLTWSSTDATSCTASGAWSGSVATSGSQSTGALTSTSTFTLTCTGDGGTAAPLSATVTVVPVPTVAIGASPTAIASGASSTLTWSSANATSCTASGAWSGAKATSGSQSTGALSSTGTFTLTCSGIGGIAAQSATVTVVPVPTVTISASPTAIASGASSMLTWSSTDATGCTASGAWSGAKATSGSESTGTLTSTSTFTLSCTGVGGTSAPQSATVTVVPAPTVTISASPTTIAFGASSTLTWSSTDATGCTASGAWSGAKATSGSESTGTLTATNTFTLNCTGIGGSDTKSATVTVLPPTPGVPGGLTATPGNGQALLSWSAVAGATSYNVYSSATLPVTTGSTKNTVSTPAATLSSLTNGTAVYAAVTAVNAGGESGLSAGACAVPTAADQTDVTLYDPFCEEALNGQKWITPLFSRSVVNGAMELRAEVSNEESRSVKFVSYQTLVNVNTSQRVTTLTSTINVPAASASRTGTGEIRALIHLIYQPPVNRLQFPGGNLNQLLFEVGLLDVGNGPQAVRVVRHCDDANCQSGSTTGVSFTDPGGFTVDPTPGTDRALAPAAYDTPYTFSVSLDETTGIFTWSVAGGGFGGGVSGTADPSAYLAANSTWAALASPRLGTGGGFLIAQAGSRVFDSGVAGGSAGGITARFGNVQVGTNNAVASLYDDFSGNSPNSGANGELSLAKWTNAGKNSAVLAGGSLTGHIQATSVTANGFTAAQAMTFNNPADINTVQTDVNITACATSVAAANASNRVQLQGNFYNDGSPGTTAPDINQPNSAVGDIRAFLQLDCATNQATFSIIRLTNAAGTNVTPVTVFPNPVVPKGADPVLGHTHTLRLEWDPPNHMFTFQVDGGTPVVVDPTVAGAFIANPAANNGPANAPLKQVVGIASVFPALGPGTTPVGSTASVDFKVNNVFTAP